MAVALPTPGGSTGVWGTMLNDFLSVSHDTDGTILAAAVSTVASKLTAGTNVVYNSTTTTDNTFQDLDLSATVGANSALVLFLVTSNTGNNAIGILPKGLIAGGELLTDYIGYANASGCCTAYIASAEAGDKRLIISMTDANGVVQIAQSTHTYTLTISTLCWIK